MTASSDIWKFFRSALRAAPVPAWPGAAAFYLLAPAVVTFAQLYYLRSAHGYLLYLLPLPAWAALLPALPLLASEYFATRYIEGRRFGPGPAVTAGLWARLAAWTLLSLVFFLFPITAFGKPDIFAPLIGLWHFVAWILLFASPVPALLLAAAIAAAYWLLVWRRGGFRFTVTLLLPAAGTAALFALLYFFPGMPLRLKLAPPPALEKLFPAEGYEDQDGRTWPRGTLHPHEVYAAPDDSWAALSLGSTFGRPGGTSPGFAWVDLRRPEFRAFHSGVQVRRFSTECPGRLYFSQWQDAAVSEYVPGADEVRRLPLPESSGGWPVSEIFSVHNACGRVYALNNLNPALFLLDGSGKLLKSVSLHEAGFVGNGAVVLQLKRNPRRKTVLVSLYAKDFADKTPFLPLMWYLHWIGAQPGRRIFEFDGETLELKGTSDPSRAFMDMAFSPDGRRLYAASVFTQEIYALDAGTLRSQGRVDAPFHVRKLEFSADGKYLYAAGYLDGNVVVYDGATARPLGYFHVTPRLEGLSATKKYLYAAGAGGLFRIPNEKIMDSLLPYGPGQSPRRGWASFMRM
ncbi:MAG: YncE family protein [Elusimicrobiales bacterium]